MSRHWIESPGAAPRVSVVVPTYNRAEILDITLSSLSRQDLRTQDYEVIVADDGSTDHTEEVVRRYVDRMRIGYAYQEDRGFRAARARNLGAAQASGDLLVLLDSGEAIASYCLSAHLRAHGMDPDAPATPSAALDPAPKVVLGYVYGYNKSSGDGAVDPADFRASPDALIERFRAERYPLDLREPNFQEIGDDLSRLAAPWTFFWTCNVSVPLPAFRAVGGFDEQFVGWGGEDIELGLRLYELGLRFELCRDAATVEFPHERDRVGNLISHEKNFGLALRKHLNPIVETASVSRARFLHHRLEELFEALDQRLALVTGAPPGAQPDSGPTAGDPGQDTYVVFGADALPSVPAARWCVEPDERIIAAVQEHADATREVIPLFGFRTPLPDKCADRALIAASMRHYPTWALELIILECERLARQGVQWLPDNSGGTLSTPSVGTDAHA